MKKQFKRKTTADIQKMVTDIVIEGLEKDICPWIKPWESASIGGTPKTTIPRESIMHLTR